MTQAPRLAPEELLMALADRFYAEVSADEVLRALYPDEDLTDAARHLGWFLVQARGGPLTYFDRRGHPSLRARHVPFPITGGLRDRWLRHMRTALDGSGIDDGERAKLWRWFVASADALVNVP
ncbi:globin domain-containing protein [Saccharothrix algeriensis]|uniref:Hemoglobin n=2 Tax=Saccharothrix algeriensis TaxID=173560 RepID=A0ABS2S0P7_9PSEU|nr:globin [Saccharothrix algeriensis]MBM7809802.1 hemoglobin [Saccharothrix algeriensis]